MSINYLSFKYPQLANLPLPDKTAWATLKKETFYE